MMAKTRVSIYVRYRPDWYSLHTVYKALFESPDFEVIVVAGEELFGYREYTTDYLFELGIPHVPESLYHPEVHDPQIIFCTTPGSGARRPWIMRERSKIVFIPYGSGVADGEAILNWQYNMPLHQQSWRIYCQGSFHKDLYKTHGDIGDDVVKPLGHPKQEWLYSDYEDSKSDGYFKFLWNIHFAVDDAWSSWADNAENLFALPDQIENTALIVRPHPAFWSVAGSASYQEILKRTESDPRFSFDKEPDMKPSFESSDAMISDGSSLVFDYAFTLKPIIYLAKENPAPLNTLFTEFIGTCHYSAHSQKGLFDLANMLASGQDPKAEIRKQFLIERAADMVPPAGTAQRIVEDIRLGLKVDSQDQASELV